MKAHVMRRIIMVSGATAFCVVAAAQEALLCVNPDVLSALVFNARAETQVVISRSLPARTEGYLAPEGFTLVGTSVRGGGVATTVAYRTGRTADVALGDVVNLLTTQGWRREEAPQRDPAFVPSGGMPLSARLCRDGERRGVNVRDIGGVRYAMLTSLETLPPRACGVPAPQEPMDQNPVATTMATRAFLPKLQFPATARMAAPGGNWNSGDAMEESSRIQSSDSAASLAEHLAPQLVAQGWQADAKWSGTLSSGSTWSRKGDGGQTLWGRLELIDIGAGNKDVSFALTRQR